MLECAWVFLLAIYVLPVTHAQIIESKLPAGIAVVPVPSMAPPALRSLIERSVPILMFHIVRPALSSDTKDIKLFAVTPEVFDQQLSYLEQHGYSIISFQDLSDYFNGTKQLPGNPIILSFDDGWKNQYRYAFPLLQKHSMHATFFIFTNPMEYNHPHYISWDEIREMSAAGMTFGAHTITHPKLTDITDEKVLEREIIDSKKVIEERIGKPVTLFAYPFGLYNEHILDIVKKAGYTAARTTKWGTMQSSDKLFELKEINVNNDFQKFVSNLESRDN